ncbi:MAG: ribulokinase [Alicyclobacillus sp.]|nr:ribulokinase [Alicyclobacillus sp.]
MSHAIGVDFGTESGRVLLLNLATGVEVTTCVIPYRSGVISERLPSTGEPLPPDWALQDPADYLEVLYQGVPDVLSRAGTDGQEVIGMGIDFTSCTVLPVSADGEPLCTDPRWRTRKHAWPKLWKHHAAQRIADRMTAVAVARNEPFLKRYGGRISSEWYFPKLLEIFEEDREVFEACGSFIEALDWVVWYLTGHERRSAGAAGFKALWSADEGLPSSDYFQSVHPEFTCPEEKLGNKFYPLGTKAGRLRAEVAQRLGLTTDVAVAVGNIDSMVAVPGAGVTSPGTLVMVMGTSLCHLLVTKDEVLVPGITGVVRDGLVPGYYGYEAGQPAMGDILAWFVKSIRPQGMGSGDHVYASDASNAGAVDVVGETPFQRLELQARELLPGQHGLVALDWWNGNRSVLGDSDLTGLLVGLTLHTGAHEIYRALLESTAFGTRRIVDNFRNHGVSITELVACGGLPRKSPLLMQIFADVCGLPVRVCGAHEVSARGAALFGAVAAGSSAGGFDSIGEAARRLRPPTLRSYQPVESAHRVYNDIYSLYCELYTYFGTERADLMHSLKRIRNAQHRVGSPS